MPAVVCPECDARVSVPNGTYANTEVTCPSCCVTFLTPETAEFPPKPDRAAVLGSRSDYVDAEAFTVPDPVVKKPKRPKLVISGPVTVFFIVGSVLIGAFAMSTFVYTTLKVQGRIGGDARPAGHPLGGSVSDPAETVRVAEAPVPPPVARDRNRTEVMFRPNPATAPGPEPSSGVAQPATGEEAWGLLVGTWKLIEKPVVDPQDEPTLQKLTFEPDKSAVLTDNLFEYSKGLSPNYEELCTVIAVKVTAGGVVLHLRDRATGDDESLTLSFDARDRITVRLRQREAGPVYLFRFAKS